MLIFLLIKRIVTLSYLNKVINKNSDRILYWVISQANFAKFSTCFTTLDIKINMITPYQEHRGNPPPQTFELLQRLKIFLSITTTKIRIQKNLSAILIGVDERVIY